MRIVITALLMWSACSVAFGGERLFTCKFSHYSSLNLKIEKAEDFLLQFILRDDETASLIGNNGAAPVIPFQDAEKINFLEITEAGNIMLTTIDTRGVAVHSRHTVLTGLVPSQYYGKCQFK